MEISKACKIAISTPKSKPAPCMWRATPSSKRYARSTTPTASLPNSASRNMVTVTIFPLAESARVGNVVTGSNFRTNNAAKAGDRRLRNFVPVTIFPATDRPLTRRSLIPVPLQNNLPRPRNQERHELLRITLPARFRDDPQLLIDRLVQRLVHLNHFAGFAQHQRIRREHRIGVLRFAILLRHADVLRVHNFGFHLLPNIQLLE